MLLPVIGNITRGAETTTSPAPNSTRVDSSKSIEVVLEQAYQEKDQGRYREALRHFETALQQSPENGDVIFQIALLLSWTGRVDESRRYIDKLLTAHPEHSDAKVLKARILGWQGEYAQAQKLCDEVIYSSPHYLEAYYIKARIFIWQSNVEQAEDVYQQLLELEPNDIPANVGLANLMTNRGDYTAAKSLLEKASVIEPNNVDVQLGLARLAFAEKKWNQSENILSRILEEDPNHTEAKNQLDRLRTLKQPGFETRYYYTKSTGYDPLTLLYNAPLRRHEVSQIINLRYSPTLTGDFMYKRISETEPSGGGRNYGIEADEYSASLSKDFSQHWAFSGRVTSGYYRNVKGRMYNLNGEQNVISGFGTVRYRRGKLLLNAGYWREPLYPIIRGSEYLVDEIDSIGGWGRINLSEGLSLTSGFYDREYYDTYHRKEFLVGIEGPLPVFRQCRLGYTYRNLDNPSDNIHRTALTCERRIGPVDCLGSFALETDSHLGMQVYEYDLSVFYNLSEDLRFSASLSYEYETPTDRERLLKLGGFIQYRF